MNDPRTRAKLLVIVWGSDPQPFEAEVRAHADPQEQWRDVVYIEARTDEEVLAAYNKMGCPWQIFATKSTPDTCIETLGAEKV